MIVGSIPRSIIDGYGVPPDPEQLQKLTGRLGKLHELALVFTWIAGLLNILAIWDCVYGPAYGFGDEHVNALIRQALAIPSFTLVVIDPAPKSDFVNHLKELGDERVWLVSGRQLGTFEHFVAKLLPDLRDEEITAKVMKTYKALMPSPKNTEPSAGDADDI